MIIFMSSLTVLTGLLLVFGAFQVTPRTRKNLAPQIVISAIGFFGCVAWFMATGSTPIWVG